MDGLRFLVPSTQRTYSQLNMSVQKKTMFPLGGNGLSYWAFFVGAFLVYANTLTHSYALDDYLIIIHNELVQAGWSKIGELLTAPFAWALDLMMACIGP